MEHMAVVQSEFRHYFPRIEDAGRIHVTLARNPFRCEVDDLPDSIQEEFLELINSTAAKEEFQNLSISAFWAKMSPIFPKTSEVALKVLIPFSSTYLCESGFTTLLMIKSKLRNRLEAEDDLRCALSNTTPRIIDLVSKKQINTSH